MITYRYVDFPNLKEIAKQILEILPDLHKDTNVYKSYDKDFFFKIKPLVESVEKFKPWNDMFDIAIVSTKANSSLPIHKDFGPIEKTIYSLNIPIYNCDKSYNILYKLKENAQPEKRTDDKNEYEYFKYKEKDVEEVARFYLTQAVLFNTQMPHTAINPTNEPRIMLTMRFNTPLTI
jgi:hypothetical protein